MFLKIADITHLIIHQHQRTLNSNENKNMKHTSWFVLQSPLEEFLVPTFIVRRLLYVFKTMCIRGLLLPFIKKDRIFFWSNFALPHCASSVLHCLEANNVSFVRSSRSKSSQHCPIEKIWTLIEHMIYQGEWEVERFGPVVKSKIKQLH